MNNKKLPQRKQTKKRTGVRRNSNIVGGASIGMSQSGTVVAVNTNMNSPTYLRMLAAKPHAELGEGIRIHGCQLLTSAVTTADDSDLFSGGTATVGVNAIRLSPDRLNGRCALIARNYGRFVFREFKIFYKPRVATSQAGSFALGYVQDGYADNYATMSFETVLQIVPSILSPFREPACLQFNYKGDQVYFMEINDTTAADIRQTSQGVIVGFPDASSIGALTMGQLWIEYVVDLYQPVMDFGFAIRCASKEEYEYLSEGLRKHRESTGTIIKTFKPW